MSDWKSVLLHIANDVEKEWDLCLNRLKDRLGWMDTVIILPYRGYGTADEVHLKGRVVEDRHITSAEDTDSVWENLLNIYRRFASNEIDEARVRLRFGDVTQEAVTNNDGFFEFTFKPDPKMLQEPAYWYEAELELVEYPGPAQTLEQTRVKAEFLIPPPNAQFGLISDVDDTVVRTDAVNLLKMARNTFLHNAQTRLPFNGVAAFYTALQMGTQPGLHNPIFYLSSGYWNLYDLLIDFFRIRGVPHGPLFLTDIGITPEYFITPGHHLHKFGHIKLLLEAYPDLPFILSGDSGQKDLEIYVEAAETFPGRISAIYIRDVSDKIRDEAVQALVARAAAVGTDMLLVEDTVAAAVHAADNGFILPDALEAIRQESESDEQPPNPIEAALDEGTLA
jgi:phosphatidate phosphatase APP1